MSLVYDGETPLAIRRPERLEGPVSLQEVSTHDDAVKGVPRVLRGCGIESPSARNFSDLDLGELLGRKGELPKPTLILEDKSPERSGLDRDEGDEVLTTGQADGRTADEAFWVAEQGHEESISQTPGG